MQWLFVIGLIALVYFFFIKKKPLSQGNRPHHKKDKNRGDEMVACEKCGTYISLNEALIKDGQYFCSPECMKA
jgi:uncharacterized protein